MTERKHGIMPRRRRPIVTTVLAAVAASLLVAACGSSSPAASRANGPPTEAQLRQTQQAVTAFASCMRSHGLADFPDPNVSPRGFKQAFADQSPAFQTAYSACGHLLPAGHSSNQSPAHSQAQIAAFLAFARCLRARGYPNFPDPTTTGDITHEMLASAGIDVQQPQLVRAADGCAAVTHGFITTGEIARFVSGR